MGGLSDQFSRLKAVAAEWCAIAYAVAHEWLLQKKSTGDGFDAARSGILVRLEPERFSAVGLAVLINILAIWILAANLHLAQTDSPQDLHATLFPTRPQSQPPPDPQLVSPSIPLVPEPVIMIEPDTPPTATITAMSMAQMLAPRPDTNHINVAPPLPALFRALGNGITLILKIFVQPDGSISDAHIVKTSGDAKLDEFAVEYVKANWRYIPASISGKAVDDWTTVLVPFKA
jgi:TonB family protein